MFQIKNSSSALRATILSLLPVLAVALSGCASIRMGAQSQADPAVTGGYRSGETLAVLLPESGRFAGAARIVHDGIVAAQEADPQGARPNLRFYDSGSGSVKALVQRAAADGASLVIGPLQKPKVDELAGSSALPIPVLALNQASGHRNPPRNLYQFSLSPEDEAAEVAAKAWGMEMQRALILYPEGPWGNRISRAFRQSWKALGGQVAGAQVYNPSAADYSGPVAGIAKRAEGADFLFLVATPGDARRIFPQARQKLGAEIPVYSSSHSYGGRFDPKADRALVGLNFVEIPWLVEPVRGDSVSSKGLSGKLPRLYAMGVDAYRLGSRLPWLSKNPRARVLGKTGILGMDGHGKIYRQLTLVRIEAGGPVKIAATDSAEPETLTWSMPPASAGVHPAAMEFPRLASLRD
jgi:outer membrane PBP1 activator LpoA protein